MYLFSNYLQKFTIHLPTKMLVLAGKRLQAKDTLSRTSKCARKTREVTRLQLKIKAKPVNAAYCLRSQEHWNPGLAHQDSTNQKLGDRCDNRFQSTDVLFRQRMDDNCSNERGMKTVEGQLARK